MQARIDSESSGDESIDKKGTQKNSFKEALLRNEKKVAVF
jgi:hypothetical protein